jgi:hypothetical protein
MSVVLFILYHVVSVAYILYPLTRTALTENIKLVGTRHLQMLDNDRADKIGGHFKMAVFENRCVILVKIFVVIGCFKRTRVPAIYTTSLRTYIKFIIVILFLFFAEHGLNKIKSNQLFGCSS